ncbi:MSCRAMM family protein, partial [Faecalibacterium prausnitzii]|uniref:MSCRAMM family protein n=1 Tax=Faecalibacterium prausnitzii TaxID=853 RepID=UPI00164D59A4
RKYNIGKVVNRPITGKLELIKQICRWKTSSQYRFRIRNDAGEIVAEGYTNDEGVATFTLGYGSYSYEEFDAPDGYQIDTTPHKFFYHQRWRNYQSADDK